MIILLLNSSSPVTANLEMGTPTIDGIINDVEWSGRDVEDYFFIDADNSDGNIDAQNRLLIGEDEENLYIGLDLNSDQTVDPSSEWVGIWLNTNNRSFSNPIEWIHYLNDGTESLILNVSTEEIFEPWSNTGNDGGESYGVDVEWLITPSIYDDYSGDYTNLTMDSTGSYYTINSTLNDGYEITRLDFELDISNLFGELMDEYSDHLTQFNFWINYRLNETISTHRCVVWKPDGTLDINDPDQYISGSTTGGSSREISAIFNAGNITAENKIKMSILANSSLGPFQIQYETLVVDIYHDPINELAQNLIRHPFSTIQNAEYAVGFGPSSLNATPHRQFEFKIPKSELEHYDSAEDLGIYLAGYGTLAIDYTDYWVYPLHDYDMLEENSGEYHYYNMNGVESGDAISITNPNDISYHIMQTNHAITWTITDTDVFQPLYTVYQNGLEIESGSWTSDSFIVVDVDNLARGTYNYTIIATDGYGGRIQDEVIVIVTTLVLSSPADINLTVGSAGNFINWTACGETTSHPPYSVYLDGTLIKTRIWTSGEEILFEITDLAPGTYTYLIKVFDGYGDSVEDEVIVIISDEIEEGSIPSYPPSLLMGSSISLIVFLTYWKKRRIRGKRAIFPSFS